MHKHFYFLICVCMLYFKTTAQSNILDTLYQFSYFASAFGPNGSCLQLSDSSFAISATVGATNSNYDLYLFSIITNGDTLWAKAATFSAIGNAVGIKSNFDNNNNILTAGSFHVDSIVNSMESIMWKTDSLGNIDWFKTYGIAQYSQFQGVYGYVPIATFDNHYMLVGALDIDSVNCDFLIIKTDTAGNEISRWQYGTPKYNLPQAGIQTLDSGFLFAGLTTYADVPDYYTFSIYIVKVDKNGTLLWDTIYSSPRDTNGILLDDDVANDVLEVPDGYIVCGDRFARPNTVYPYEPTAYQKAWIAKLNKQDGSIIWEQNIGIDNATYQRFFKMTQTSDGGYAACGARLFSDQTTGDCWMVKMDAQGDSLWARSFSFADNDTLSTAFYNILQTRNNGYILEGFAAPPGSHGSPWVIITDSMGCLIPGCDTLTAIDIKASLDDKVGLAVYPNPAGNMAYILIKTDNEEPDLSFKIYTATGQLIATQTHATTDVTYLVNTSNFAKGVYLVDVMSGGKMVAERKLVKE